MDLCHAQLVKAWRGGMRGRLWHKDGITALCTIPQQRLERCTPSQRQRLDTQCALQLIMRVIRRIKKRVDLRDSHALGRLANFQDFITRADVALLQNAKIES